MLIINKLDYLHHHIYATVLQKFSDHPFDGTFGLCKAYGSTGTERCPNVLGLSTVLLAGAWLPWVIRRHCDYAPCRYDEQ